MLFYFFVISLTYCVIIWERIVLTRKYSPVIVCFHKNRANIFQCYIFCAFVSLSLFSLFSKHIKKRAGDRPTQKGENMKKIWWLYSTKYLCPCHERAFQLSYKIVNILCPTDTTKAAILIIRWLISIALLSDRACRSDNDHPAVHAF